MGKKRIQVGNALLCEYATQGNRNKHVLVNVYSGNVRFASMPADFSFGLYIEVPAQELHRVNVSVRLDGKEFLGVQTESDAGKDGTIVIQMVPLHVEEPATLTVVLEAEGRASTTVINKRLYVSDLN